MIFEELTEEYEKLKGRIQEIYNRLNQLREELQMLQDAAFSVRKKAEGFDAITAQLMQTVDRACACGSGFRMMESYREQMSSVINGPNKSRLMSQIDNALAVGRESELELQNEEDRLKYELQSNEQSMNSVQAELMSVGDSL